MPETSGTPQSEGVDDMYSLEPPFFEVGPKNFLRLPELLELGKWLEDAAAKHRVRVIYTVPSLALQAVASAFPSLVVAAQHVGADYLGPSMGVDLPEGVVDAGGKAVMLNHDAHPLTEMELRAATERAHACDLLVIAASGTPGAVDAAAWVGADVVLYEPADLIGGNRQVDRPWIREIDARVAAVNPQALVMHAGGVRGPDDVRLIMRAGASGTGVTSAVIRAEDRRLAVDQLLAATREGWDENGSRA